MTTEGKEEKRKRFEELKELERRLDYDRQIAETTNVLQRNHDTALAKTNDDLYALCAKLGVKMEEISRKVSETAQLKERQLAEYRMEVEQCIEMVDAWEVQTRQLNRSQKHLAFKDALYQQIQKKLGVLQREQKVSLKVKPTSAVQTMNRLMNGIKTHGIIIQAPPTKTVATSRPLAKPTKGAVGCTPIGTGAAVAATSVTSPEPLSSFLDLSFFENLQAHMNSEEPEQERDDPPTAELIPGLAPPLTIRAKKVLPKAAKPILPTAAPKKESHLLDWHRGTKLATESASKSADAQKNANVSVESQLSKSLEVPKDTNGSSKVSSSSMTLPEWEWEAEASDSSRGDEGSSPGGRPTQYGQPPPLLKTPFGGPPLPPLRSHCFVKFVCESKDEENWDDDAPTDSGFSGSCPVPVSVKVEAAVSPHQLVHPPSESDRPDLTQLLSSDGVLRGRFIMSLGSYAQGRKHLNGPIGANRNEVTGQWIVCDTRNNLVKVFNSLNGELELVIGDKDGVEMKKPSAVVVLSIGGEQLLAVKDDLKILILDAANGKLRTVIGERFLRTPYGLGQSSEGGLVTLNHAFVGSSATELVEFDPVTGELKTRLPYVSCPKKGVRVIIRGRKKDSNSSPRFLDVRGNCVVATDLGLDKVYVTKLSDGMEVCRFGVNGRRPGELSFVSGVRFDGAGNLLIGDAWNNRIQLFDEKGRFVAPVELESPTGGRPPCPYVSDIHLTNDGYLMACCLRQNIVNVFKLGH